MRLRDSWQESSRETMLRRYGDLPQFMGRFTAAHEAEYCPHVWRCVLGSAPTLGQVNTAYGRHTAAAWLVPLLWDVSEFCGCKDKLTDRQMGELAYIIVSGWHWLKVTEVMLFLWWLKGGKYGKFYGAVDPMTITSALREFVGQRNAIIARSIAIGRERRQEEWKKRAVSYAEWQAMRDAKAVGAAGKEDTA